VFLKKWSRVIGMGLAELFEFRVNERELRNEIRRLERLARRRREILEDLREAERLVEYCLHYRTGTTCELAIRKLRKVAEELEEETFPYRR